MDRQQLEELTFEQLQVEAIRYGIKPPQDRDACLEAIAQHIERDPPPIDLMGSLTGIAPTSTESSLMQMCSLMLEQGRQHQILMQQMFAAMNLNNQASSIPVAVPTAQSHVSDTSQQDLRPSLSSASTGQAVKLLSTHLLDFSGTEDEDVEEAVIKRFRRPVLFHVTMQKVESRRWNHMKESFHDYAMDKLVLMKNLNLPERDSIDLLINGVGSRSTRELAAALKVYTIDDFLEEMHRITTASGEALRKSPSFARKNYVAKAATTPNSKDTNQTKETFCVYCRTKGHTRDDCYKLRKKDKPTTGQPKAKATPPVAAVERQEEAAPSTSSSVVAVVAESTSHCVNAFESLKAALISFPVLRLYNPGAETELHTDASSVALAAILLQKQESGQWTPISYYSQTTNNAEARYHSYELEMLAVVKAIERFHIYLYGLQFTVVTDCHALVYAVNKAQLNPRIARWTLRLQNYRFNVELQFRQLQDSRLKNIAEDLEFADDEKFELIEGLVYKKGPDKPRFVIPESMVTNVIRVYHDEMAHCGPEKTAQGIKSNYWFPSLNKKIQDHIDNCLTCILNNVSSNANEGELQLTDKAKGPFDVLHTDHFGPISESINELDSQATRLDAQRLASETIDKIKAYNKEYYDKHHKKPTKYNSGDYVMIRDTSVKPGENKKFKPSYKGPYMVAKALDKNRNTLIRIENYGTIVCQ
ncbi:hypothetical protein RF55_13169 [Lasius niger]|uniref:RNA-directed DNA polymerase n=1 Tax=Lasius niger TaxID=67767 RepID=A0A0J7KB94_LASNI|nr:hypothetical protein RF55_13169 [Lasius niger]